MTGKAVLFYHINDFGKKKVFDIIFILIFFRVPQYIYPSTAYMAATATTPNVLTSSLTSPMSPTAAGQYIDYSAYAAQFAAAGAYEAAYPYGTTASAFVTPSGAAYTAYAMPQQIAAGTAAIHFQPQQIQAERMQ